MFSAEQVGAFLGEFEKLAMNPGVKKVLSGITHMTEPLEVAGLGVLAAPSVDNMIARRRATRAGIKSPTSADLDKYRLIKDKYHDAAEAGGLGVLAAPIVSGRLLHGKWGH